MKISYFISCIFLDLCFFQMCLSQKINQEILIKNAFLIESRIVNNHDCTLEDYYNSFSFKTFELGNNKYDLRGKNFFLIDSFKVYNERIVNKNNLKDSAYIVVIEDCRLYRLKGFSYNDFPFLLKSYLEENEDYSVREIIDELNDSYNLENKMYIDFECLYEAFRAKEINYDVYPCMESYPISQDICVQTGFNERVCVKKGGEPIGYRGTKYKKSKYRKRMEKHNK